MSLFSFAGATTVFSPLSTGTFGSFFLIVSRESCLDLSKGYQSFIFLSFR